MKVMMLKNWSACAMLGLMTLAACNDSNEDLAGGPDGSGNGNTPMTNVKFELNADNLNFGGVTKAIKPSYSENGFRIMAFKKDEEGNDYQYMDVVDLKKMTYNGGKLTGTAELPIGTYKFVPMYGIESSAIQATVNAGDVLSDQLVLTHANPTDVVPAIFVENTPMGSQQSYDLGRTSDENKTVTATVARAVARVDLLLIRVNEDGTPKTDGGDVFGGENIADISMAFTKVKNTMGFTGYNNDGTIDPTFHVDLAGGAITKGEGTETLVGTPTYLKYDNVEKTDIINGGAHIQGPYLFPHGSKIEGANKGETSLEIVIDRGANKTPRSITIGGPVPLWRNYVTLITLRVYGDDIFKTDVKFDVTIDTKWAGSETISGDVK